MSSPAQRPPVAEGPEPDRRPARASRADLFLFLAVPVALGVVFLAVLLAERAGIEGDLQVIAPSRARAGGTLPIRAFHFHRLERPSGPELASAPAHAELRDADGRVLAETTLRPAAVPGLEGALDLPPEARGRLTLRLSAALTPEQTSRVDAPVTVSAEPQPSEPVGRLSLPLQRFRVFPVRAVEGLEPPSLLEPRVVGGACVPEVRCDLLVLVGEPAAAIVVEPSGAVTPAEVEPVPTAGLVRLSVVTHGPDAQLDLVARRDGEVVARRSVRLPIALASSKLAVGGDGLGSLATAPATPTLHVEGLETERGVIVDAWRDGVWERTGSVPPGEVAGGFPVPFAPLTHGLWRIQTRTDPFSADSAATRFTYVAEPGRPARAAFEALIERARDEWEDPLADDLAAHVDDPQQGAAFLLAAPELDLIPQPIAISGQMQQATGLDDRRVRIRWAGALAVLLAGIVVAVLVWRRGLSAGSQARAILTAAGDEEAQSDRARRRGALTALAYAVAIALAFLAAAALILARGG